MSHDLINTVIDNYRILRLIGEGGMGRVYEADHTLMERRVAIKVLRRADHTMFKRLERECRALMAVPPVATPKLYSWGVTADGFFYLAMEYVDGSSLEEVLDSAPDKVLKWEDVRQIGIGVSKALSVIHAAGLVHRDLKPSNIIIQRNGDGIDVKLLDLGIAYAVCPDVDFTATNSVVGSIGYMSPEHFSPQTLGPRSDLFSVGCIMYRSLVGVTPFEADSLPEMMMKMQANERAALPNTVPPYLQSIVDSCLATDQEMRISSAEALHSALASEQEVTAQHTVHKSKSASTHLTWHRLRNFAFPALIVAVLGLVLVVTVVPKFLGVDRPSQRSDWFDTEENAAFLKHIPLNDSIDNQVNAIYEAPDNRTIESMLRLRIKQLSLAGNRDAARALQQRLADFLERTSDLRGAEEEREDLTNYYRSIFADNSEPVFESSVKLGSVQSRMGNHTAALVNLERAAKYLQLHESKDKSSIAKLHYHLGVSYKDLGRTREAQREFEAAVSANREVNDFGQESSALKALRDFEPPDSQRSKQLQTQIILCDARAGITSLNRFLTDKGVNNSVDSSEVRDSIDAATVLFDNKLEKEYAGQLAGVCYYIGMAYLADNRVPESKLWFERSLKCAADLPPGLHKTKVMMSGLHGLLRSDRGGAARVAQRIASDLAAANGDVLEDAATFDVFIDDCVSLIKSKTSGAPQLVHALYAYLDKAIAEKQPLRIRISAANRLGKLREALKLPPPMIEMEAVLSDIKVAQQERMAAAKKFPNDAIAQQAAVPIRDRFQPMGAAALYHRLSTAHKAAGDQQKALQACLDAYELATTTDNKKLRAICAAYVGDKRMELGDVNRSKPFLEETIKECDTVLSATTAKGEIDTAIEMNDYATVRLATIQAKDGQVENAVNLCDKAFATWTRFHRTSTYSDDVRKLRAKLVAQLKEQGKPIPKPAKPIAKP